MKKTIYLLILITATFFSCSTDEIPNFDEKNQLDIIKYIADNNLNATKSSSGLYYVINSEGTGAKPTSKSTVTVNYKGYFLDGKNFDQSKDGFKTNLQQVIKGWTEGITYFKEGGSGILLIPSKLGYGVSSRGKIPGGSVLIFDIELLKVN